MTHEERIAKLSPEHHHFAQMPDPWHIQVLGRFDWFRKAFEEGRVHQAEGYAALHSGDIAVVWYSVDANGKLLQEWGFDAPEVLH